MGLVENRVAAVRVHHILHLQVSHIHVEEIGNFLHLSLPPEIDLGRAVPSHGSCYLGIGVHGLALKTHVVNLICLKDLVGHGAAYVQGAGRIGSRIGVNLKVHCL